MGRERTEHNGAKNGGGYWGRRAEAKARSKKVRRAKDKQLAKPDAAILVPVKLQKLYL